MFLLNFCCAIYLDTPCKDADKEKRAQIQFQGLVARSAVLIVPCHCYVCLMCYPKTKRVANVFVLMILRADAPAADPL